MKKILLVIFGVAMLAFGSAYANDIRDVKGLEEVHKHVQEAIKELNQARAANHYDMKGHGEKAEKALHEAERELHEGIEAARSGK